MIRSCRLVPALFALLLCAAPALGRNAQGSVDHEAERIEAQLGQIERGHRQHGSEPIPLLERLLWVREATLGPDDLEVARCLLRLARAYLEVGGRFPEMIEPLLLRALHIRQARLGPTDPGAAEMLDVLGVLYVHTGEFNKAETQLRRGLALRKAAFGSRHSLVATSLDRLAWAYRKKGECQRAIPLFEEALRVREAMQGPHHLDTAETLSHLGQTRRDLAQYGEALALFERALRIREAALGPEGYEVALSLSDLGWVNRILGAFDKAEHQHTRALAIYKKLLGLAHPQVGTGYFDLGYLCADQGHYSCAEEYYQQALAIRQRTLPADSQYIGQVLVELGDVYQQQGALDQALAMLEQALRITRIRLGPRHDQTGAILYKIAQVQRMLGSYAGADVLLRQTLDILKDEFGPESEAVATILDELAMLRRGLGAAREAEPLLEHALSIVRSIRVEETAQIARIQYHQALLAHDQGDLGRAKRLYRHALAVAKTTLGPGHPDLAAMAVDLSRLIASQGDIRRALALLRRAFVIAEGRLRSDALAISEQRLGGLLNLMRQQEDVIYSVLAEHLDDVEVRRLALATALLRKGRSVDEVASFSRALYQSLPAEDRERLQHLRVLRSRIATLSLAGPGDTPVEGYRQQLNDLEREAESVEQNLIRHTSLLRHRRLQVGMDDVIAQVSAALPQDGLLLEIIQARVQALAAPGHQPGELRYLALTLSPQGAVRAMDLGPAKDLDALSDVLVRALTDPASDPVKPAREFFRQVLRPFGPQLAGRRHLFLSLDGELALVPFAALHDGRGYLVDRYLTTYLTSGRDLLASQGETRPATDAVVIADPALSALPAVSAKVTAERARGFRLDGLAPLPGARQEAAALHGLLPHARMLLGQDATESTLLSLHAPGILHVATHGIFLEDAGGAPESARGFRHAASPPPGNPLLRSALVLAGAEVLSTAGQAGAPEQGDGLATAMEIAGMDLWGTQLVVLSACDMGRGQARRGDGIHGMRRAVMVAGAETLVTGLWKVNDEATRDLMVAFYQKLLAGEDRGEALRRAALQVRERHPHPYYWAAFIVVGRAGPLRHLARAPRHQASVTGTHLAWH